MMVDNGSNAWQNDSLNGQPDKYRTGGIFVSDKLRTSIKIIGNILFAVGAAIGLTILIKNVIFSGSLPAGACPFVLDRPWLYLSIGLLAGSFILSLFEGKKTAKAEPDVRHTIHRE